MKIDADENAAFKDGEFAECLGLAQAAPTTAQRRASDPAKARTRKAGADKGVETAQLSNLIHRVFGELNEWVLNEDSARAIVFLVGRRAERLRLAIHQLSAHNLPQTQMFVHQLGDALPQGPSTAAMRNLLAQISEEMNGLPLQAAALVDYFAADRGVEPGHERHRPASKSSARSLTWRFFVAIGVALLLIIWLSTRSGYR